MEELDNPTGNERLDDEEMFLKYVIREDYELLYLHTYLEAVLASSNCWYPR